MPERSTTPPTLATEFKAYSLYFLLYVPIVIAVIGFLGLFLPYVFLGIKPSSAIAGWKALWFVLYLLGCGLVALVAGAIAWLLAARGFVTYALAERVLMPVGTDPVGRWLIRRFLKDPLRGEHDV